MANGIDLEILRQYIEVIAKKKISSENAVYVTTGVVSEALGGFYTIKLSEGSGSEEIKNVKAIDEKADYQVDDYVYLIQVESKSGDLQKKDYKIFGKVQSTNEEFMNLSEWERFHPLNDYSFIIVNDELKNIEDISSSSNSEETPEEIKDDYDVFIEQLNLNRSFCMMGNFTYQGGFTLESDYGIVMTLTYTDDSSEDFELTADYFSGQPFNMKNSAQKRVFTIPLNAKIKSVETKGYTNEVSGATVSNLKVLVGKYYDIEDKLSVKVFVAEGSQDYFTLANGENEKVTLQAAAYIEDKNLDSDYVNYYWFLKDDSVTEESLPGYYSFFGGPGWRCLNDFDVIESVDIKGNSTQVIKWRGKNKTFDFSITKVDPLTRSPLLNKFINKVKCVVQYRTAKKESEIFEITNYKEHGLMAILNAPKTENERILLSEDEYITLSVSVEDKKRIVNVKDNVNLSYKWFVDNEEIIVKDENDNQIPLTSTLIIRDTKEGVGYNINSGFYDLKNTENGILTSIFSCEVSADFKDTEEEEYKNLKLDFEEENTVGITSYVHTDSIVEANRKYKYWISKVISIPFNKKDGSYVFPDEGIYVSTKDIEINSEKTYYEKNGFVVVEEPTGVPNGVYYEWSDSDKIYFLSSDTEVNPTTTYYKKETDGKYHEVPNPVERDLGSYKEREEGFQEAIEKGSLTDLLNNNIFNNIEDGIWYLHYTYETYWNEKESPILLRTEPWVYPQILRQVKISDNGTKIEDIAATAEIEQFNTFNQLTNNGSSQGIYWSGEEDGSGDLYINASYINTGTLRVGDETEEKFYASINNPEVRIAGFEVTDHSIESQDKNILLDSKNKEFHLGPEGDRDLSYSNGELSVKGKITATELHIEENATVEGKVKASAIFVPDVDNNGSDDDPKKKYVFYASDGNFPIIDPNTNENIKGVYAKNLSSISANMGTITAGKLQSKVYETEGGKEILKLLPTKVENLTSTRGPVYTNPNSSSVTLYEFTVYYKINLDTNVTLAGATIQFPGANSSVSPNSYSFTVRDANYNQSTVKSNLRYNNLTKSTNGSCYVTFELITPISIPARGSLIAPAIEMIFYYQGLEKFSSFIAKGALFGLTAESGDEDETLFPLIRFPYMNLTTEGLFLTDCNISIDKSISFGKDYDGILINDNESDLTAGQYGYSDLRITNKKIAKTSTDQLGFLNETDIYNFDSFIPIPQIQYGKVFSKIKGAWISQQIIFPKPFEEEPVILANIYPSKGDALERPGYVLPVIDEPTDGKYKSFTLKFRVQYNNATDDGIYAEMVWVAYSNGLRKNDITITNSSTTPQ